MNSISKLSLLTLFFISSAAVGQLVQSSEDSIAGYKKIQNANGDVLAWYKPETEGAAYSHVAKLASEFIKSGTPVDPASGLPLYFISCCFQGPHMRSQEEFDKGVTWEDWMHNPACVFAGMVQSLVLDYRVYSGDREYIDVVREMLDYQLKNGTTLADWPWANVPYASSDPGDTIYSGSVRWQHDGMRGDGRYGIEPDKVGELGIAYLKFYEVTEEPKYLKAAMDCADALAKHVRDVRSDVTNPFDEFDISKSPWPYRVNARTNSEISSYCSNVIEPIRLFDELIRIRGRIELDPAKAEAYQKARDIAFGWLYSKNGPITTGVWNGYFEDVPNDPAMTNRVQVTPLETARYLIKNPELDPNIHYTVPALLHWVGAGFATEGLDAIKEQTWCYEPMGSHTARYASICALWYEHTGDERWKKEALKHFNVATYMTDPNGVVRVGPGWPGSWFSDGYGDYIRHFMEGLASVPEWAPADENHLLKSTSAIQDVSYSENKINYKTFDQASRSVLRLTSKPVQILVDNQPLSNEKWSWKQLSSGGVCVIDHQEGKTTKIVLNNGRN